MRETGPGRLDSDVVHLPDSETGDERQHFIFYQDDGGLRATDELNGPMDTIYYLGIIDICTPYTTFKRAEHIWKGLHADRVRVYTTFSPLVSAFSNTTFSPSSTRSAP
jgi:1-phosphatidylinositol-4-phosphate 5-kinase